MVHDENVKINICILAVALTQSSTVVFYYVEPIKYCIQIIDQFSENRIVRIQDCEPYNEIATIFHLSLFYSIFRTPVSERYFLHTNYLHPFKSFAKWRSCCLQCSQPSRTRPCRQWHLVLRVSFILRRRYYQGYYIAQSSKQLDAQSFLRLRVHYVEFCNQSISLCHWL